MARDVDSDASGAMTPRGTRRLEERESRRRGKDANSNGSSNEGSDASDAEFTEMEDTKSRQFNSMMDSLSKNKEKSSSAIQVRAASKPAAKSEDAVEPSSRTGRPMHATSRGNAPSVPKKRRSGSQMRSLISSAMAATGSDDLSSDRRANAMLLSRGLRHRSRLESSLNDLLNQQETPGESKREQEGLVDELLTELAACDEQNEEWSATLVALANEQSSGT